MPPSIWTRCGGAANARRLAARAVRVVEGQHVVATRKLVDSVEEQEILESLIEGQKPPLPRTDEFRGLHYLLATSFRYPPLRHGSRFGTRAERSIWYGAEGLRPAFAEAAYYRLVFLAGTGTDLGPVEVDVTSFAIGIRTRRGIDLCGPAFAAFAAEISSPERYQASQRLGREMRAAGIEAFRYRSARDRLGGRNFGVFTPAAFAARRPGSFATWHCTATPGLVEFVRRDFTHRTAHVFPRTDFEVGGVLPVPAL
ncbi:MAG: RES family NAD+ phosphorylase [Acidobacteria bacterium]|nr:RES family NAD+ phosphorylase [Acidobacteriota bacterium]